MQKSWDNHNTSWENTENLKTIKIKSQENHEQIVRKSQEHAENHEKIIKTVTRTYRQS